MICISMLLFLSACAAPTVDLPEQLVNPRIVAEDTYYRLYQDENQIYFYAIFDKDGNIAKSELFPREPHIEVHDNTLISISMQAGTGIESRWTYYYDVAEDAFSDVFYTVFGQEGGRIVYSDGMSIIVRDIFSETVFTRTFDRFDGIAQDVASPFVNAEFIENGQKIRVTYLNEHLDAVTVDFELK